MREISVCLHCIGTGLKHPSQLKAVPRCEGRFSCDRDFLDCQIFSSHSFHLSLHSLFTALRNLQRATCRLAVARYSLRAIDSSVLASLTRNKQLV